MQNITIFTDGASRGNPGSGGWGAIVICPNGKITIANNEKGMTNNEVKELGGRELNTTNNRMELTAVIHALEFASKKITIPHSSFLIRVYTDSSYVLKGAKEWVKGWQKNNWQTKTKQPVLNQDLWEKYLKVSDGLKIEWNLLKGHSGIPANERCDEIATAFADGEDFKLFSGPMEKYPVSLKIPSVKTPRHSSFDIRHSSKKPYSYVSFVKGVAKTHQTWVECEKRVKGVSGAKFKKSFSLEDEKQIINTWSR